MERNYRCKWDVENIRMNVWYRRTTVCLLHRLAEGIRSYKLDQINAHPK